MPEEVETKSKKVLNIVLGVVAFLGVIGLLYLGYYLVNKYFLVKPLAFDWKNGSVPESFDQANAANWDYVSFDSEYTDGTRSTLNIWFPTGEPTVGSRTIKLTDEGDDVTALQRALNMMRTDDKNDPYYFDELAVNGHYDEATQKVVKLIQKYYSQDQNGDADLNFQASVYGQITGTDI